jgi:hypothetical protein
MSKVIKMGLFYIYTVLRDNTINKIINNIQRLKKYWTFWIHPILSLD